LKSLSYIPKSILNYQNESAASSVLLPVTYLHRTVKHLQPGLHWLPENTVYFELPSSTVVVAEAWKSLLCMVDISKICLFSALSVQNQCLHLCVCKCLEVSGAEISLWFPTHAVSSRPITTDWAIQSEQSRLLERRGLERLSPLSNRFRHCEKRGDAAMYIMRKCKCYLTLDACIPFLGDFQNRNR